MNSRKLIVGLLGTAICAGLAAAQQASTPRAETKTDRRPRVALTKVTPRFRKNSAESLQTAPSATIPLEMTHSSGNLDITSESLAGDNNSLPLWTYKIRAPRGGDIQIGAVVGHNPFSNPGMDRVPAYIVPLVFRTHRIATSIDPTTFAFSSIPGDTTIDPTVPDNTCMASPNNVPVNVVRESPLFEATKFTFGGVDVGTTQYLDAYERASFWKALGPRANNYHLLLDPVRVTTPVVVDVPANEGIAINDPQLFAAFGSSFCAPLQLVDWYWFDAHFRGEIFPKLAGQGIGPNSLPIFLSYDAVYAFGVDNFLNCCYVGYDSVVGYPINTQAFAVAEFDRTQLFSGPSTGLDTMILSQEIGNWADDPYLSYAPPWCSAATNEYFLQVGDPLFGTSLPPVTMPNGYHYYLQELAFFSWFFGAPSLGVNGWYSNNGTFRTPAGPICP